MRKKKYLVSPSPERVEGRSKADNEFYKDAYELLIVKEPKAPKKTRPKNN